MISLCLTDSEIPTLSPIVVTSSLMATTSDVSADAQNTIERKEEDASTSSSPKPSWLAFSSSSSMSSPSSPSSASSSAVSSEPIVDKAEDRAPNDKGLGLLELCGAEEADQPHGLRLDKYASLSPGLPLRDSSPVLASPSARAISPHTEQSESGSFDRVVGGQRSRKIKASEATARRHAPDPLDLSNILKAAIYSTWNWRYALTHASAQAPPAIASPETAVRDPEDYMDFTFLEDLEDDETSAQDLVIAGPKNYNNGDGESRSDCPHSAVSIETIYCTPCTSCTHSPSPSLANELPTTSPLDEYFTPLSSPVYREESSADTAELQTLPSPGTTDSEQSLVAALDCKPRAPHAVDHDEGRKYHPLWPSSPIWGSGETL